jgi:hypothetical protein
LCFENTEARGPIKSYADLLDRFGTEIIVSALIATLSRKSQERRKGSLERPGGFFTQRCREYAAKGIPGEIRELVRACQEHTSEEIKEYLHERAGGAYAATICLSYS